MFQKLIVRWGVYSALLATPIAQAGDLSLQAATEGQFQSPQIYNVLPGTRLNALANTWKLVPNAYRLGISLERMSQKPLQERARSSLLYQLPDMRIDEQTKASLKHQIESFKVTGRVLQAFDWDAIELRTQQNRLIRQGDVIVAPKRPNSIIIGGAAKVQKLSFKANRTVAEYVENIHRLDGADPSYVWVISPDTTRYKVGVSYWNTEKAYLAPGSAIYVPLKDTLFHSYQEFNQSMLRLYAAQELPQ